MSFYAIDGRVKILVLLLIVCFSFVQTVCIACFKFTFQYVLVLKLFPIICIFRFNRNKPSFNKKGYSFNKTGSSSWDNLSLMVLHVFCFKYFLPKSLEMNTRKL